VPPVFFEYVIERARKYSAIMDNLSDKQRAAADKATTEAIMKNKERLSNSQWLKAMRRDVEMFGDDAFTIGFSQPAGRKKPPDSQ
jgi:hypothetical protein